MKIIQAFAVSAICSASVMHAPASAQAPISNEVAVDAAKPVEVGGAACSVAASNGPPAREDISRTILGGAPSALDRIRANQQGIAVAQLAPGVSLASLDRSSVRRTLEPSSRKPVSITLPGGGDCGPSSMLEPLDKASAAYEASLELGTRAISVKRTRFDDRWEKVRRAAPAALMQAKLRRADAGPGLNEQEMLARVNQWVNREIAYVSDDRNYRERDVWATAEETIARGSGDCEDFAILKMHMLRAAGVAAERMKLVLLRDLAANADHAVLLVQTDAGKVVLDNVTDRLYDGSEANSVRPVVSFSEGRRWVHAVRGTQALAEQQ